MRTDYELRARLINQIKEEFANFCGLLSIDEIASNLRLMRLIEDAERSLLLTKYGS